MNSLFSTLVSTDLWTKYTMLAVKPEFKNEKKSMSLRRRLKRFKDCVQSVIDRYPDYIGDMELPNPAPRDNLPRKRWFDPATTTKQYYFLPSKDFIIRYTEDNLVELQKDQDRHLKWRDVHAALVNFNVNKQIQDSRNIFGPEAEFGDFPDTNSDYESQSDVDSTPEYTLVCECFDQLYVRFRELFKEEKVYMEPISFDDFTTLRHHYDDFVGIENMNTGP